MSGKLSGGSGAEGGSRRALGKGLVLERPLKCVGMGGIPGKEIG